MLPALSSFAEVHFPRAACRREDIEQIVADFEAADLDALLLIDLSYSPSQIVVPAPRRSNLPLLVWNTQELFAVDRDYSTEKMMFNHGVHGTQDLGNALFRSEIPFEYVTSHINDPGGLKPLEDFFAAAAAVHSLRHCRAGILGYPFPGMGDLAVDTTHLAATLGCQCVTLSVNDYIRRASASPCEQVRALTKEYRELYAVAEDVTEEDLEVAARAELSLRSIIADRQLDALSLQFLALGEDERTVTLPFVGISRLMAEGLGYAGEGDLLGAVGTWFLNRLDAPASFSEIFTVDFEGNSLLFSHMGEANAAMARKDAKIPLVAWPRPITSMHGRLLVLAACFEPGPATLCSLTLGPSQRWRMIASAIDIVDFGPLSAFPFPHGKITNHSDVRRVADGLCQGRRTTSPRHLFR